MTTKDIARNENEVIRIQPKEYKGIDYIDIRIWYKNEAGEFAPTKKGICFTLPQFKLFLGTMKEWV